MWWGTDLGLAQPSMLIPGADSPTTTYGAFVSQSG